MLSASTCSATSSAPIDFAYILNRLKGNLHHPVSGGYSPALRGIVELPDGSSVFAKHARDGWVAAGLRKEAAMYQYLNEVGFPHCPRLFGFDGETLVLPDLRNWDWAPFRTKGKLDAVMAAAHRIGELKPSDDLGPLLAFTVGPVMEDSWKALLEDDAWKTVIEKADEFAPDGHPLANITAAQRRRAVDLVKAKAFDRGILTHLDIRSDNVAYDPNTGEVLLLDWNWAELNSPELDRTILLISVFLEPPESLSADISFQDYVKKIDPLSALGLAGYWCANFTRPPLDSGDPKLRAYQFRSACLAWQLAGL